MDTFPVEIDQQTAARYLESEGALDLFQARGREGQIPPNLPDLARLHKLVRTRKVFTVLEFGVGYSTIAMAHALARNKADWERLDAPPKLRKTDPFKVHAVDASKEWIENAAALIPADLKPFVELSYSPVRAERFNGRLCHVFESVPDVVPELIYLDGPDPALVEGAVCGLSFANPERVVMAADILVMEPTLLPGCMIVVDGRTANVRFLQNNLQRSYTSVQDTNGQVTLMELAEPPIGPLNRRHLHHALGEDYFRRYGFTP